MYKLKNPIFSLLLVSVFITSCKGQTTSKETIEHVVEPLSFTNKSTKLTKTQNTSKHQNIHSSLQDKDGKLWFGTSGEGVYRYDGKEFTQFTEKDGLSNNSIWSILEDKSGNIWFGTDDGLCRFDGKKISKIPFTIANSNGFGISIPLSGKISVWSMLQDKNGTIWFGTSQDLYCYDGKSFSRFLNKGNISNPQHLQLKWIQCFLEDSKGIIWMGSGPLGQEGVIRYDGQTITSSKPNGDGWIRYIIEGKDGQIWFSGRQNGVFRYDGQTFKSFTEKTNIGSAIFKDKTGNIWFDGGEKSNSTESIDGLWRYDGKTFEHFTSKDGMGKNSVWNILEDSNNNIWIGTRNCQLYRYNGQTFESFSE